MTLEDFKKLKKYIHEQIKWDEDNLLEMEQKLSVLYQEVQDVLTNQRLLYENLLLEKDQIYGKLYESFKFESVRQWDTKNEIDSQIKSNHKYYEKALECNQLAVIVEYLENTLKNISSIGYQIRDFIKYKIFQSGRDF